jgi:hypothetical protein
MRERPLRRYGHRPAMIRVERDIQVTAIVDHRAVAKSVRQLRSWGYATNAPPSSPWRT